LRDPTNKIMHAKEWKCDCSVPERTKLHRASHNPTRGLGTEIDIEFSAPIGARGISADDPLQRQTKRGGYRARIPARHHCLRETALNGIELPSADPNSEEFGDSYNSVTNISRRGFFGIGCHRASPRSVAFSGPPFVRTRGPSFRDSYCTVHRNVNGLSPKFLTFLL
jgi:hypothetical protein